NYLAVMGACQMIRRNLFERVGGYDERYRVANSDVALCLRAWRTGARLVYTPYAALTHHEGLTRGRSNPEEDVERTAADLVELGVLEDPYFHPGLSADHAARERIRAAFAAPPARVRQLYRLREDLRHAFPLALTPAGRREFFQWLTAHGRQEQGVRPEELWWFLLECDEDPPRELVRSYGLHAGWQRRFPDGLAVFGREAFTDWLRERHGIDASWLDPSRWPVSLTPLDEVRLGYAAHETWRRAVPDAFVDVDGMRALVAWLRRQGQPSPEQHPEWWARLEAEMAADGLVGLNVLGHFCYPSGLQASARAIVESLRRVGVRTASRDVP